MFCRCSTCAARVPGPLEVYAALGPRVPHMPHVPHMAHTHGVPGQHSLAEQKSTFLWTVTALHEANFMIVLVKDQ